MFDNFNNLDDIDKYIHLIFKSRAFNYNNISHLCPILDIVNYKYGEKKALFDDESFCCKNENLINCDDEFCHGYEDHSDIINFYINYNFIPSVFNTVSIPSNFFSLNIPSNKKEQIDQKFWNILGNKISNKKNIVFENFITPIDFKFQMNSIVSNSIIEKNITKSVLELMKNEIKYPVIFDATHSVQAPGGLGGSSGGDRQFVPVLSKAAVAVGVAGVFMETHNDPDNAPSDGPNMVKIDDLPIILSKLIEIDNVVKES